MAPSNRSARDLGPDDFVWDYFCRGTEDSMLDRVQPAADAGYAGVGIHLGAWAELRQDPDEIDRFEDALRETGLVLANIETFRGWASPDGPDERCLELESLAWELNARFECRYVQVIGNYTGTIAEAAQGFASLCDRAADHGLLVGLEAVPSMTNIDSLGLAAEIVQRADRPNGGLCFDSWHLTRSTNNVDDILALPGELVLSTQWNDGPIEPTIPDNYYTDTLTTRVAPGEGAFQLREMIAALDTIGSTAPVGLEVPSTDLWAGPIDDVARHTYDAMRALIAEVRG